MIPMQQLYYKKEKNSIEKKNHALRDSHFLAPRAGLEPATS